MRYATLAAVLVTGFAATGCSSSTLGGAALGAGAAGVAYEVYNEDAMDDLQESYESGDISRSEYERRKDKIEDRSLVQ